MFRKIELKRIFDIFLVMLVSPLIFFLFLSISFVFLYKRLPIIFKQERPGVDGKIFTLYKFKTMSDDKDIDGNLLPDELRITKFGKFLRHSSLDEIPSFFNVMKGDMSIVGPRPLLEEYLILYSQEQKKRHNVRPGITGLAQISGRNSLSWDEKLKLDIWYVENRNLILDIKIIFKTIFKVLKRDGISHDTHATMPKFKGK